MGSCGLMAAAPFYYLNFLVEPAPFCSKYDPAAFKLIANQVSPSEVVFVNYGCAGEVKTGSF
jgi:hypothetical protein